MSTEQVSRVPDLSSLKIDDRSRNSGRTGKRLSLFAAGLGAIVLLAGFVFAFKGQKPAVEVGIARGAGNSNAPALLNASGYVTPRRRSTVAAKITGRVTAVFAEEGMRVKAGQVLAALDNADARTRLESARADRDATAACMADWEANLANAERASSGSGADNCGQPARANRAGQRTGARRRCPDQRGPAGFREHHGPRAVGHGRVLGGSGESPG